MRVRVLEGLAGHHADVAGWAAAEAGVWATPLPAQRGVLHVATCDGDALALGRLHRRPAGVAGVGLWRRRGGGRVAAAGAGFLHVALHLPHRAALVADAPDALAAAQVLNRAVRGLLGGLAALGVEATYPGQDLLTVDGRTLAVLGFDEAASGRTVVEAVVSLSRDLAVLPGLLDRADPAGVVPATLWLPDAVASIAGACGGSAPSRDAIVAALAAGFRERLGVEVVPGSVPAPSAVPDELPERRADAAFDGHAETASQLGRIAVAVARAPDGTLRRVQLGGDLLAPAHAVARLEAALVGVPPTRERVGPLVARALAPPEGFVLGVRDPGVIADLIVAAAS
jgi:hypothetical protein